MGGERPKQRRAVGPRLRLLLHGVLGAFVLLTLNALYLIGVRVLEHETGELYQDHVYQFMFLGHLALGLVIISPEIDHLPAQSDLVAFSSLSRSPFWSLDCSWSDSKG